MSECLKAVKDKTKRDLFRFGTDKPTTINLAHVTMINLDRNKITFSFTANAMSVDLENEDVAKNVYEQVLKVWTGDVVE